METLAPILTLRSWTNYRLLIKSINRTSINVIVDVVPFTSLLPVTFIIKLGLCRIWICAC